MTAYRFKAVTEGGAIIRGTLEAPSERALANALRREGKYLLALHTAASWQASLEPLRQRWSKIGLQKRLGMATQELATLLSAGIELDRALSLVASLKDLGSLADVFAEVRDRVRNGTTLADALEQHPEFSTFYVSMVRACEFGGTLDSGLSRLADHLLRSLAIREAVVSALFYPAILLCSAAVSIGIILFFVLPAFEPLFAESNVPIPIPALFALAISHFLRSYWWLLAAITAAGVWYARSLFAKAEIRTALDRKVLTLPVIGDLIRSVQVERFLRGTAASLHAGVSLPAALSLAAGSITNTALAGTVRRTAASLREGDSLSERLHESGDFPAATIDIVRIGEETGRLDELLLRQADLDQGRIRSRIDRLLALLVPSLTILLGLLVAGLIAAMLTTILGVNEVALQ